MGGFFFMYPMLLLCVPSRSLPTHVLRRLRKPFWRLAVERCALVRPKGNRQNNCLREGKVHFANQACRRKVTVGCPIELS